MIKLGLLEAVEREAERRMLEKEIVLESDNFNWLDLKVQQVQSERMTSAKRLEELHERLRELREEE